ncbi:MAG: hypothetical protein ACRC6V_09215 [Bacteroidales bacterium]
MRKIKNIKDLHGLKNGNGLEIFIDNNDGTLSVGFPWHHNIINRIRLDKVNTELLAFIKTLGFDFECQPKRTLEEILSNYEEIDFVVGSPNCCICRDFKDGVYCIDFHYDCETLGTKYYSEEDAKKICEELNS